MNARDRAKAFLDQQRLRGIMRTGDPVQDLIDFVLAERGREPELEDAHAVVLYLDSAESAEEIKAAFLEAKPGCITRSVG